jgi:hypothetical protein
MAITCTSSFEAGHGSSFGVDGNDVSFNATSDGTPTAIGGWFYVKLSDVDGTTPSITVTVSDGGALASGIRPVYSFDQSTWYDVSSNWSNPTLTFSLPEISGHTDVWIAAAVPYTYTDLLADIAIWDNSSLVTVTDMGDSQGSRNMYHLEIDDSGSSKTKAVIFITCRCHPGEPVGSYVLKGMIDWLISSDTDAVMFRKFNTVHIIPMVNPDGVYAGRNRALDNGIDANRDYDYTTGPNAGTESEETYLIHSKIYSVNSATPITLFFDIHGSVEAPNAWRNAAAWPSWLENLIEWRLQGFDTDSFWTPTFQEHALTSGTYRSGVYTQYGLPAAALEGYFLGYGAFGFPETADLEAGGEVFLKTVMSLYTYNDFTELPGLFNLWDFENGALGTDDAGSDDLSTINNATTSLAVAPSQKVGSYAATFDGTDDALTRADASLATNHPWKSGSSGDWSLCGWTYFTNFVAQAAVGPQKYDTTGSARSIKIVRITSTYPSSLAIMWGATGGGSYNALVPNSSFTFSNASWYFVELAYDESELKLYVRVWNESTQAYEVGTDSAFVELSPANTFNRSGAAIGFGCTPYAASYTDDKNGLEDQWLFSTSLLSLEDFTQIRQGIYGNAGGVDAAMAGAASLSLSPSTAGAIAVGIAFGGTDSISLAESTAGVLKSGISIAGSESISSSESTAGAAKIGTEFDGTASISSAESVSGDIVIGLSISGTASLSETTAQPGTIDIGEAVDQILTGVASLSLSPSTAGGIAVGTIFAGAESISLSEAVSGDINAGLSLSGVSSISSAPATAGTVQYGATRIMTGVSSISSAEAVSGDIVSGISVRAPPSISAAPATSGTAAIGLIFSGQSSISEATSVAGSLFEGSVLGEFTGTRTTDISERYRAVDKSAVYRAVPRQ